MRDILFRGFHPSKNGEQTIFLEGKEIKGEWVEGDLIHGVAEQKGIVFIRSKMADNPFGYVEYGVISETVGQFTGIYDSTKWEELTSDEQALFLYPPEGGTRSRDDWKGRKIFEGFIVDIDAQVKELFSEVEDGEVVYRRGGFFVGDASYFLKSLDVISNCDGVFRGKVIGNIFSNPELLNKN